MIMVMLMAGMKLVKNENWLRVVYLTLPDDEC